MTVETRQIGRFHASYRLPARELGARARLDGLLELVLDAALDGALTRAGVGPEEEVCIRSAAAGARLRLVATDEALVADWSASLAEAIAAAIAAGEPAAVRYSSRRQALVDVALGAAAGDLRRAWAWRQLGLWPDEDAAGGAEAVLRLVDALAAEPRAVVPVLAAAARRGALPRLAVLLSTDGWLRLAAAALTAAGAPAELLHEETEVERLAAVPAAEPVAARARRLFASSALATAAAGSGAAAGLGPAARRALAILALLEVDPGSLAVLPGGGAADRRAELVTALATELDAAAPSGRRKPEGRRATDSRSALAEAGLEPELGARTGVEDGAETSRTLADDEPDGPTDVRARGWTSFGGLLFLLPLAAELEPPERRTLRWALHRLALVLLPELDEADPAALAFAGLGPDELPPSDDGEPATETELAGLQAFADDVATRLAGLLERDLVEGLLPAVCARRAEVVAEPGWIELRLSFDELDIDVRRAGLDLDPGWLPWLGVVVRFTYA